MRKKIKMGQFMLLLTKIMGTSSILYIICFVYYQYLKIKYNVNNLEKCEKELTKFDFLMCVFGIANMAIVIICVIILLLLIIWRI